MSNRINIPTSFKLVNRTYTVEKLDPALSEGLSRAGDCNQRLALIRVAHDSSEDYMHHTFYHELVHAMLDASTNPKLSNNEKLVDSLGALLHQYVQTKTGNLIVKGK